ncbi:hypothetical protein HBA54_03135 [Pelagibius litoralis]|uniref:Uncharacterized protein n=1 Tax=Pelagibius litoralis TaxID=374515 RepID=A0A967C1P4_9PROT|nr:hypothetical protein [Pelagibius litoralis]NIA67576.1 hypothetical protein [Pelagibius litoralis]
MAFSYPYPKLAIQKRHDLLELPGVTVVANYRADNVTDDGGGNASAWPDRTGNGYDLSQATPANRAAIIADGGADFKSRPILRFDGVNDSVFRATTPVLTQPFTQIVIAKATLLSGGNKIVFTGRSALNADIFWNSSEVLAFNAGGNLTGTTGNDVSVVVEAFYNGASCVLRGNGSIEASGALGAEGMNGVTVGTWYNGTAVWGGDLAEAAIVDGELTAKARTYLAHYARQRYGIA